MKDAIAARLAECGGLQLHPDRTRIVYCKKTGGHGRHGQVSLTFWGTRSNRGRAKRADGTPFMTFSPAISGKSATAIRQEIRRMRLHLRSDLSFKGVAAMINAKAGGWAAYFGRYRPSKTASVLSHIDRYLVRWARRKYKHLRRAPARAYRTLVGIKKSRPRTAGPLEMGSPALNSYGTSRMTRAV